MFLWYYFVKEPVQIIHLWVCFELKDQSEHGCSNRGRVGRAVGYSAFGITVRASLLCLRFGGELWNGRGLGRWVRRYFAWSFFAKSSSRGWWITWQAYRLEDGQSQPFGTFLVGIVFPSLDAYNWKPISARGVLESAQVEADFGCLVKREVGVRIQMLRIKGICWCNAGIAVDQEFAIALKCHSSIDHVGIWFVFVKQLNLCTLTELYQVYYILVAVRASSSKLFLLFSFSFFLPIGWMTSSRFLNFFRSVADLTNSFTFNSKHLNMVFDCIRCRKLVKVRYGFRDALEVSVMWDPCCLSQSQACLISSGFSCIELCCLLF